VWSFLRIHSSQLEEDIAVIQKAISTKGAIKRIEKAWERIGKAKHLPVRQENTIVYPQIMKSKFSKKTD